jgi:DNA-binding transcriptional regulator YdaS (Cro superfamily)
VTSGQYHTLEYAAKLVGGEDELALRLGVTRQELDLWISGVVAPPVKIFNTAVDIVTDAAMAALSQGIQ